HRLYPLNAFLVGSLKGWGKSFVVIHDSLVRHFLGLDCESCEFHVFWRFSFYQQIRVVYRLWHFGKRNPLPLSSFVAIGNILRIWIAILTKLSLSPRGAHDVELALIHVEHSWHQILVPRNFLIARLRHVEDQPEFARHFASIVTPLLRNVDDV